MAEDAASTSAEETQITFNIKSSSDAKYVLTLPLSTTVADLKTKLSTPEYADLPAERQRLIYSGRVLKDPDTLASMKIKDGHTVHLVKGANSNARQNPANQGSSSTGTSSTPAAPQVPTNLATGTGNNPLAGLTGARYAGFHGLPGADMFGPDGGMGPPPEPEEFLNMMENPQFLSQFNEAMNNPAFIEMMANNPMVRDNPMMAQVLRNPELRRTLFSPEMLRRQLQLHRALNPGGSNAFPAPGITDTTPPGGTTTGTGTTQQPANPFAMLGGLGGAGGAENPFTALFGPTGANPFANTPASANSNTTPTTSPPPTASANQGTPANPTPSHQPGNPFADLFGAAGTGQTGPNPLAEMTQQLMQNPEAMRAAMQMMGGMPGGGPNPFSATPAAGNIGAGATANPFANLFGPGGFGALGGMGGMGSPPPPVDNRPPEELYASQLRQLNDMGFYEFERNVQALRRSGGSVQGALEFLLNGA
ncbi:hypothetical protein K432DRAFT_399876 [Lepidopterella palustris CBS 459.81]|uniref:Uncharacterized protein n=1 Tax=Lepidopterella palustris CBS 459.81 TaxID=1314670 RepID=A0A8E2ELT9_9PEZI|nr:hypothetical protein K432DRAFT_399876 [Lepidopterella palustris CBS 459.81]